MATGDVMNGFPYRVTVRQNGVVVVCDEYRTRAAAEAYRVYWRTFDPSARVAVEHAPAWDYQPDAEDACPTCGFVATGAVIDATGAKELVCKLAHHWRVE